MIPRSCDGIVKRPRAGAILRTRYQFPTLLPPACGACYAPNGDSREKRLAPKSRHQARRLTMISVRRLILFYRKRMFSYSKESHDLLGETCERVFSDYIVSETFGYGRALPFSEREGGDERPF